jgi:protein-tyrosine-phosphatase
VRTCAKYGIRIDHRARQVTEEDFKKFDFLLAMDTENLEDLQAIVADFDNDEHSRLGRGDYCRKPGLT